MSPATYEASLEADIKMQRANEWGEGECVRF